ncbi:sugar phosphate isomerase/epimerase [Cereibacter sp. SYSU M97828]|nr:sugar phosphate isomerase/epimerase [Cereibacter flavus]
MRINACSVAFRHMDVTAAGLAEYTLAHGFDGLEIWLPHARRMIDAWADLPRRPRVPMLAAYLPLGDGFDATGAREVCALTRAWGAKRLRLFAGNVGSDQPEHRPAILRDLHVAADIAQDHGLNIAVEIHPHTMADNPDMALRLLEDADHPALGLNFDVLHVWESGADPIEAEAALRPHILHYHLKTVTARDRLGVFDAGNIHDPQGRRDGICPLFEGALDYAAILDAIPGGDASLEWFGPEPGAAMRVDLSRIHRLRARPAVA